MLAFSQLLVICLTSAGWAFSFGVGTQVVSHWLNAHGASQSDIGLNNATYYLGIALASLATPWLARRFGNRCAAFGMILTGVILSVFPWVHGDAVWFLLRFVTGVAGALSLIPLETVVSRDSDPAVRTRNFSFYAVALTLGAAIGICSGLHFYDISPKLSFFLGGIVPVAAGASLWVVLPFSLGSAEKPSPLSLSWTRDFPSLATAWCQGFLEGGMIIFLSLYLVSLGMSKDAAGVQMGVTMVGVLVFQVPVAWLADRFGRVRLLLTSYFMVALLLAVLPLLELSWALSVCLLLFGAWSGAMYPLGLALLGEGTKNANLARAYAWYMAMECIGSQMGAAAMGEARDIWGEASMFPVGLAAVLAVLSIWGGIHFSRSLRSSREVVAADETQRRAA